MTIRVLLADDHSIVRQGLRVFLSLDAELEIVASEATNGKEALQLVQQIRPDVVLMDLVMPDMDGIAATEALRDVAPQTRVVILTNVLEDTQLTSALRAGANGYLLKDADADELCRAIKIAATGQVHLAPRVAMRLARGMQVPERSEILTRREVDVLRLLASGASNKEISRDLSLGEKTIKTHVSNILSKLGVQSRTQAALQAVHLGLVPLRHN